MRSAGVGTRGVSDSRRLAHANSEAVTEITSRGSGIRSVALLLPVSSTRRQFEIARSALHSRLPLAICRLQTRVRRWSPSRFQDRRIFSSEPRLARGCVELHLDKAEGRI